MVIAHHGAGCENHPRSLVNALGGRTLSGGLRIAWIGPTPGEHGGAPFVGTQLLQELARAGVEVDCFIAAKAEDLPASLASEPGIRFFLLDSGWRWGRWYSRSPMVSFFSGNAARAATQWRLARTIVREHRARPYDLVYQFSQSELTALRRHRRRLPPLVVHPSTHAAGELRWHRREASLSRRCEPLFKRTLVRAILTARAAVQRRDLRLAARVIGVSRRFVEHLEHDYALPADRLGVVRNPIDLERFRPGPSAPLGTPISLLYVSRMSARKGVEMVIELSHRLADLEGVVRIRAVGGPTTWSDYRPLLNDLNPAVASYHGRIAPMDLSFLYQHAGAVLQPSQYEPFALTVGEALACGTPVVASDEVGAIDGLPDAVCRVFRAGEMDDFERAVRGLVRDLQNGDLDDLRRRARDEAERLFAPPVVTRDLIAELSRARLA